MIRGRYLSSMDDTQQVMDLRMQVFGKGEDEGDKMAVYAMALNHQGTPAGAGRLFIDDGDSFRLDYLGVAEDCRRQGMGDLMIRMLLQRALDLNAPRIVLDAPTQQLQVFFAKYGFELQDPEGRMEATPQTIERCYGCSGHCRH